MNKARMTCTCHAQLPQKHPLRLLTTALAVLVMWCVSSAPVFAAGGGKSKTIDSPFIGQSQITATVMRSLRPIGIFQVDLGILVETPTHRARAAALQPVLRNAWRRTTQEFANSYYVVGRVPDGQLLAQRLQTATDQVMGARTSRVLLISIIVR